ncbi:MAG: hypothetical protein HUN04_09255 [Desulfobacter sp.]|nr:MAG: hypothetical protein HUN04_09255 [Desulfobacter sp.]
MGGLNIPWQSGAEFKAALDFLGYIDSKRYNDLGPVRSLARRIEMRFHRMAGDLDSLCARTCPGCTDNCCQRAVIWYDFRDLLYLYFSPDGGPDRMPDRQIVKSGDLCPHLGAAGCRLPRDRRPFVCTWYFCPAQKSEAAGLALNEAVLEIKAARIDMEAEFCRITGPRPKVEDTGGL